jgi:hypothetical protein
MALDRSFQGRFMRTMVGRADTVVGAPWQFQSSVAEAGLAAFMRADLGSITFDDLPAPFHEVDKVLMAYVSHRRGRYRVELKEIDVATRLAGPVLMVETPQRRHLAHEAFRLAWEAFSATAEVTGVEGHEATLRVRAAALPCRDSALRMVPPGAVLRPLILYRERDGRWRATRMIEWTFLTVQQRDATQALCEIHTGLRSPLSSRRRGRRDQLAMVVPPVSGSTQLSLSTGGDHARPLVGYELFAYGPDSKATRALGLTDPNGQLAITAGAHPVQILVVRNGGSFLARIPMMPGLDPQLQLQLPSDDVRLEAEGYITLLQQRLVDLVSRRAILGAMIRKYAEEGKKKEAEELLGELRRLPTREQLLLTLEQQQRGMLARNDNPRAERRIESLFTDTRKLLSKYLDPAEVRKVEDLLRSSSARRPEAQASHLVSAEGR